MITKPKINWFEGLSKSVACMNCGHWERHPSDLENLEPELGDCKACDRMTIADYFCKYFELKELSNEH